MQKANRTLSNQRLRLPKTIPTKCPSSLSLQLPPCITMYKAGSPKLPPQSNPHVFENKVLGGDLMGIPVTTDRKLESRNYCVRDHMALTLANRCLFSIRGDG